MTRIAVDGDGSYGTRVAVEVDGCRWTGMLPPHLDPLAVTRPARSIPGATLDVEWLVHFPDGTTAIWRQQFRDGVERSVWLSDAARCRLELELDYADLLAFCYKGAPAESFLEPQGFLEMSTPLSCLTGLLQGPHARRRDTVPSVVIDALRCWSG